MGGVRPLARRQLSGFRGANARFFAKSTDRLPSTSTVRLGGLGTGMDGGGMFAPTKYGPSKRDGGRPRAATALSQPAQSPQGSRDRSATTTAHPIPSFLLSRKSSRYGDNDLAELPPEPRELRRLGSMRYSHLVSEPGVRSQARITFYDRGTSDILSGPHYTELISNFGKEKGGTWAFPKEAQWASVRRPTQLSNAWQYTNTAGPRQMPTNIDSVSYRNRRDLSPKDRSEPRLQLSRRDAETYMLPQAMEIFDGALGQLAARRPLPTIRAEVEFHGNLGPCAGCRLRFEQRVKGFTNALKKFPGSSLDVWAYYTRHDSDKNYGYPEVDEHVRYVWEEGEQRANALFAKRLSQP